MGDAIKIAVKTGLIAVITAAIIALFANIQIPTVDFTNFSNALGVGLAVIYHYAPITTVLFPLVIALLGFDIGYRAFQLAMIAVRWVMKVNE